MNLRSLVVSGALAFFAIGASPVIANSDQDPYLTAPTATQFSDADFFATLNLDYPGMGSVKSAVTAGNYAAAKVALVAYFKARSGPVINTPTPATDAIIGNDRDHNFTYYGQAYDVDNVSDNHLPPTDTSNPNYPFGDIDWRYLPSTFPTNWHTLMVRFDFMSRMIANRLAHSTDSDQSPYNQDMNNVITMACDYITDIERSTASGEGLGYAGQLNAAIRLQTWCNAYFQLITAPTTVTVSGVTYSAAGPERLAGILKDIYKMATFTASDANFLGIYNNRGYLQAKALALCATYFPEFKDAGPIGTTGKWADKASTWTALYMQANIYRDGSLGESAPGYHEGQITALANSQVLGIKNTIPAYGADGEKIVGRMISFWTDLVQPDGDFPLLNDSNSVVNDTGVQAIASSYDLTNTPPTLTNRLPRQDAIFIATKQTTSPAGKVPGHTSISYPHGSTILRTGWEIDDRMAFIDNAPQGNHSHPDSLAFSLYGYGAQLILNSGRSSYDNSSTIANWHDSETEANSTIQIDSRPTKSYAKKTNMFVTTPGFDFFEGEYRDALATGLAPTDDTYIDKANPDVNYGADNAMSIRTNSTDSSTNRIAYLKFRPGNILETISSAQLQIYCTQAPSSAVTVKVYGLKQGSITIAADWNELNATWNTNSRDHDGASITSGSDVVDLGTFTFTGTGWQTFGSSSALTTFLAGETASGTRGMVTLALVETDDNKLVSFGTRKSNYRPALQIQTGSTPWNEALRHRRDVFFDRQNLYIVSDIISGATKTHQYEQLWGLNPYTTSTPSIDGNGKATATVALSSGGTAVANVQIATADYSNLSTTPSLKAGWVTFDDGIVNALNNQRLAYTRTGNSSVTFDTVIVPGKSTDPVPAVSVTRITGVGAPSTVATALKINLDGTTGDLVYYYLAHGSQSLRTFDIFQTDGQMTAVRTNQAATVVKNVSLSNCSNVYMSSNLLISSPTAIPDLYVDYTQSGKLVVSSTKPLQQQIDFYWGGTVSTIEFNGEVLVPTVISGGYRISRQLLLGEDFETGGKYTWTQSSGAGFSVQEITGNQVFEQSTSVVDAQATVGDSSWLNYTVEAKLQYAAVGNSSTHIGLLARCGTNKAYGFVYDRDPSLTGPEQGKLRIYKKSGSTVTQKAVLTYMLHAGSTYTFKAAISPNAINSAMPDLTFFVNGKKVLTATDDELDTSGNPNPLPAGPAGIIADQADIYFDDFTVTGASGMTVVTPNSTLVQTLWPSGNTYVGKNALYLNQFDHFFGDSDALIATETHATTDTTDVSDHIGYVRFPISVYKTKAGAGTLTSGKLRVSGYSEDYSVSGATATTVTVYGIYGTGDAAWSDRQPVWGDRPGQVTSTNLGTISVLAPQTYEFTSAALTTFLQGHVNDSDVAFMFVAENNGKRVTFFSDVYVQKPELVITK